MCMHEHAHIHCLESTCDILCPSAGYNGQLRCIIFKQLMAFGLHVQEGYAHVHTHFVHYRK